MESDFILRKEGVSIHPTCKIIKGKVYQQFVTAETIVRMAREEALAINDEAEGILEDAKLRSESIVADAKTFFEEEKEKGYARGIEEGKAHIADKITQTIIDREAYLSSIEDDIANTIVSAVKMIIGEVGEETVMRHLVTQALSSVRDQKNLKLKVSPQEVVFVTRLVREIQANYSDIDFIDVEPEVGLSPGGCILETKMGFVDTSIEVQLETIRKALSKHFKRNKLLFQIQDFFTFNNFCNLLGIDGRTRIYNQFLKT